MPAPVANGKKLSELALHTLGVTSRRGPARSDACRARSGPVKMSGIVTDVERLSCHSTPRSTRGARLLRRVTLPVVTVVIVSLCALCFLWRARRAPPAHSQAPRPRRPSSSTRSPPPASRSTLSTRSTRRRQANKATLDQQITATQAKISQTRKKRRAPTAPSSARPPSTPTWRPGPRRRPIRSSRAARQRRTEAHASTTASPRATSPPPSTTSTPPRTCSRPRRPRSTSRTQQAAQAEAVGTVGRSSGPVARGPADTGAQPGEGTDRHPHRPAAEGRGGSRRGGGPGQAGGGPGGRPGQAQAQAQARPSGSPPQRRPRPGGPAGGRSLHRPRRAVPERRRWPRPRARSASPTSGVASRRAAGSTARASPPGPGDRPVCRFPTTRGPRCPTAPRCRSRTSSPVTSSSTARGQPARGHVRGRAAR